MQNTQIQDQETIKVHSNPTRYQHLSDANNGVTNYASSIKPNMGIEEDWCLREICDRMLLVAEVQWLSSSTLITFGPDIATLTAYTPLLSVNFPDAITSATSTFIRDKLRNWKWFHSDIEITVKVNATKFQQGALWIRYNPRRDVLTAQENNLTNHARSVTSFPGQLLNLMDSDSVTLRFPYCAEYETFDLTNVNKQGSFGTVQIDVLSSLLGETTSETCDITVYARFVNLRVYMPTIDDLPTAELAVTKGFVSHSGVRAEESEERCEKGIVSTPAKAVAAVSDALGMIPIPSVSSFFKSLGWVSRRVADFSLAHGLSKPEGVGSLINISNMPSKGMNHVDGLDNGVNLGIIQDNEIEPFQSVVGAEDEMSYAYIAKRPWLDSAFPWALTDVKGTLIHSYAFSPIGYEVLDVTGDGRFLSTGQFLTLHHKLWHSSVKFTFKSVCTFAHSGRLQIMVLPLPAGTSSLDSVDASLTFVWDIRDSSEMSFTVPWMSNLLWEDVNQELFRIDVRVLNEMRAPSTVSGEIDVLMFASFGDDYEVAIPFRIIASGYTAGEMEIAHSGAPDNIEQLSTEESFQTDIKNVGCIASIGEQITSVRQIIKRNVQDTPILNSFITQVAASATQLTLGSGVNQGLPSTSYLDGVIPTYVGSFGRIFRFWAGSIRYKFFTSYSPAITGASNTFAQAGFGNYSIRYSSSIGSTSYFQKAEINPVIEFTVPFYSYTRKMVIGNAVSNRNNNQYIQIVNIDGAGTGVLAKLPLQTFSSAGDDFNFHFLVGPPVVQPVLD